MTTQASPTRPVLRRLGRTTFLVASRSRPGVAHYVDTLHLACSCEAGQHHIRCWHLVTALQAESWLQGASDERGSRERQ